MSKFSFIKKIILSCVFLIFNQVVGQKKTEGEPILAYISDKIKKEISFLEYEQNGNQCRVQSVQYFDFESQEYVKLNQSEIKSLFPDLCEWFTFDNRNSKSKKRVSSK